MGPIPTSGILTSDSKIVDVLDKGSGALIIIDGKSFFIRNFLRHCQ